MAARNTSSQSNVRARASDQSNPELEARASNAEYGPCDCTQAEYYTYKQNLGSENRHREYKRGTLDGLGGPLFREKVGTYVCAFLNSGGGIMYWGVNDCGEVEGIPLDGRKQDDFKAVIDEEIAKIEKPVERGDPLRVPLEDYTVRIVKVLDKSKNAIRAGNGIQKFVVECCVKPREVGDRILEYYKYAGETCIRRDASIQTFKGDATMEQ